MSRGRFVIAFLAATVLLFAANAAAGSGPGGGTAGHAVEVEPATGTGEPADTGTTGEQGEVGGATSEADRAAGVRAAQAFDVVGSGLDVVGESREEYRLGGGVVPVLVDGVESVAVPTGEPRCQYDEFFVSDPVTGERWFYSVLIDCWDCGSERIDEVETGQRAGGLADGAYAEFLVEMGGSAMADAASAGSVPEGPGTVLAGAAVGNSFGAEFMPVFFFCRRASDGGIEYGDSRYPWAIRAEAFLPDNFDVAGTRARLFDELERKVVLHLPDLAATPPLSQGRLFVRFPTWFWLHEPVADDGLDALSDLETIRVSIRATLVAVEWQFGTEKQVCLLSEMVAYVDQDPRYPPPCHKTFTKLHKREIAATSIYYVDERVQYRRSASHSWPAIAWEEHARSPIPVRQSVGPIDIGEIRSVNVPLTD